MKKATKKTNNDAKFQLWQPEKYPVELSTQKLEYIHNNPVEKGFVKNSTDWLCNSAAKYSNGNKLLDVILLDPLII